VDHFEAFLAASLALCQTLRSPLRDCGSAKFRAHKMTMPLSCELDVRGEWTSHVSNMETL